MSNFQVAYIPIGVPTFHLESAALQFKKSVDILKELTNECIYPDNPLLTLEDLRGFLNKINPDLIILQNITFANSAYANEVLKKFSCPILLWTLREPVIDGGRLRLNSLTGAYSAANLMHNLGRANFEYIYGGTEEKEVIETININIRAAKIKRELRDLNVAAIGQTPQGFGFGRALDAELSRAFGVNLEAIESRELMERARGYKEYEYEYALKEAEAKMVGLNNIPKENVDAFARLYKAYKDFINEKNIKALASRCWPDFFVEYKTPVCAVLAMLNDSSIAAACESDLFGAISMYIGMELSNKPTFFGDPVSLDETNNTVTFWHCGTAACSLARPDKGCEVGVHPNRKIGPTMEFGLKSASRITVFRIGRKANGEFRFFIAEGEALDMPKQFLGTSVVIKPTGSAKELVNKSVKDGWEPHFIVIYENVAKELEVLSNMLGIEVCTY